MPKASTTKTSKPTTNGKLALVNGKLTAVRATVTTTTTETETETEVVEETSAEATSSAIVKKAPSEKEAESSTLPTASTQKKAVTEATIDTLETDTMEDGWYEALKAEFSKPYFLQLKKFLASEFSSKTIYPTMNNIYSWSRLTPLENVKVVIVGQDPYHGEGQAHGLSFSVLEPTKPPPSLRNIYKQLANDFPKFKPPKTGDLSPIAEQGVLWLNTCLTVQASKPNSHSKKGWETFTLEAIRAVLKRKDTAFTGVVFMAWGTPAQNTLAKLSIDPKKHLVLKSVHPSPLSANKGFLGNGHFSKANEWLIKTYGKDAAIDWTVISA